jgi:diguanylate cyclase (GGDEF)-like protein
MIKSRQELMEAARQKLQDGRLTDEQRESILQTLNLMVEMADRGDKSATSSIAKIIANATHHYNLLAIIQQQAAELDALKRITFNLTSNLQLQGVLDTVVTEAMRLVKDAHDAHIFLYQDGQLKFGASLDTYGVRNQLFAMPRQDGLTYTVARSRKTMMIDDMRKHPLFSNTKTPMDGTMAGIPLMMGEMVVGVMNMSRLMVGGFTTAEMRLLALLADQAAIAIINARLHLAVSTQAMSDTLTGLPNRRALDARMDNEVQRSVRYGRSFSVLMMDLDGFKSINDTWGHLFGDQVLYELAQFLGGNLRSTDFLARYGGDELTMILPETDIASASQLGDKIHQRLAAFEITQPDGNRRHLGVSGGIAVYPRHGRTASDLLRAADEALYRAKKHARNTFLIARDVTGELQTPKGLK